MNAPGVAAIIANSKSASFRALNAHLLGPQTAPAAPEPSKGTRIRQNHAKRTKLEIQYEAYAAVEFKGHQVLAQAVRLQLANGLWYKADFYVPDLQLFIETKGPWAYRGGFENLKMAAAQHTWAKFRLVWKERGQWFMQEIVK